jgi:hypothetical protein
VESYVGASRRHDLEQASHNLRSIVHFHTTLRGEGVMMLTDMQEKGNEPAPVQGVRVDLLMILVAACRRANGESDRFEEESSGG